MKKNIKLIACFLMLTGCAGISRSCSDMGASSFGADWIVVQHKNDGSLYNCWKLRDVAIVNEEQSDGIYWLSSGGHLVHISGWYTRVQVARGNFESAAKTMNIDLSQCNG